MTKEEQIELLLTKGVADILPSKAYLEDLLYSNKKVTLYCGYDPTAPTLHIGHVITLRKLRHFQDLGHKVIFLMGDFTARIGDPDKLSIRKPLTEKEVKANLKLYKKQASKFIPFTGKNPATIKFNSTWLGKMKFADVISLASHMTVDQMLKRDMFVRRMEEEKPVYIHEFMYPLMQGYDSVVMDVDGEVGGNDQLFNMLMGRTLLKTLKNKEKFIITMKLLADANGTKMGKSEGNMIALSDTPSDIYGKVMSWTDGMIFPGFELCTDYTPSQVVSIVNELKSGINPRDIKMRLAYEIVRTCTDDKKAKEAEDSFIATFQKREVTETFPEVVGNHRTLEQLLIDEKIVTSKSDLRRLIEGGAVTDFSAKTPVSLEESKKEGVSGIYKIGKNRFIKIIES